MLASIANLKYIFRFFELTTAPCAWCCLRRTQRSWRSGQSLPTTARSCDIILVRKGRAKDGSRSACEDRIGHAAHACALSLSCALSLLILLVTWLTSCSIRSLRFPTHVALNEQKGACTSEAELSCVRYSRQELKRA